MGVLEKIGSKHGRVSKRRTLDIELRVINRSMLKVVVIHLAEVFMNNRQESLPIHYSSS
jgi:hypothetical protein